MSEKYVPCPHCGKKLGPYRSDAPTKQYATGNCPHCGKRYRIEYGKGDIEASKA